MSWPALLLFAAVTVWVAGFDIVYALMDLDVDRAQGIRSLPARFGEEQRDASRRSLLHAAMLALLALAGILDARRRGVLRRRRAVGRADRIRRVLFRSGANASLINERVFLSNMAFSVFFLITTVGAFR